MCRTGMCRFGIGNWIFLVASLLLFTFVKGGEDPDYGIRFTVEPSDLVVGPGESAVLVCAATSRGVVRLSWRHSSTSPPTREHAVTTDKHRKQLSNGSLSIESMSSSLAGQYQCVATVDGVGTIVSRIATVFLAELPTVTGGPRSVLGVSGGAMLLPCGIQAPPRIALKVLAAGQPDRRVYGMTKLHAPPPTLKLNVTWLKNGSPVRMETARVSITPSGALELDPLRPHDAASYACRVALAHAPHIHTTSEPTELHISTDMVSSESPPRFIARPAAAAVPEGSSVTFDCAAVGNPKPEMVWLNNGVAIDLSDLDSRFYLVGSGSLRVQSARALDAGSYTCRATNRIDSADTPTTLHVMTSPRAAVESGVVVARARGDVTLRCTARGKPAPAVHWLKDGDPVTPNNREIALVDGTSLRIQGVLVMDAGMFQCSAASHAGHALATVRLVVADTAEHPNTQKPNHFPKSVLNSLATMTSSSHNTTSLDTEETLFLTPEDSDFLGETSSAFTSGPELEYDMYDEEIDLNDLNSFHAADGFDLDELRRGNLTLVSSPRGLKAVIVKHRFVTLSWEEPERKEEEITGYAVIYKVKGSERERVSRGTAQRHEMNVASLQPNTTYQFSVVAFTKHGVSPPTDIIEETTPEEEISHGPPRDVTVEAAGAHALRVSWAPPLPSHSAQPTKYTIHYTELETGREQFQQIDTDPSSPLITTTLTGLRAASSYSIQVSASGGAPAVRSARTPSDVPAAPPNNVTASATGPTSILVRWESPPPRSHRGPLTGYKLRYRPLAPAPSSPTLPGGGARRKADSLTTPADARRAELRGLDTATTYQIRVCALNANGSGPFSEWVTASTVRQQRDETRVPALPPPLATRAGRDWISVHWSEENANDDVIVRSYTLGWGLGVPDTHATQLPAHIHEHVVRGLESNSEYVISLRAENAVGLGPPVYATVRTRPAADGDDVDEDEPDEEEELDEDEFDDAPPLIPPVGLKVIMLSGTTAVVYWTDPTLAKGQTATDGRRYVVRWSASGGRVRYFNATDLNCMLDDLRPFTQYEFAVKLIKGGRESAWSMLVTNSTLETAPASPPRDTRVSPATPAARAVDVTWAPPTKPNGIITGYVIMYAISRDGSTVSEEWTAVSVTGDRTRARVERLRPRTHYHFKLQARNSKGLGPPSQPVAYSTPAETGGGGGGLAHATSAWLWASAGGACAVLALAAALALSLCCRRHQPPLSPDTNTYQKSSASAAIKPPDLWIHHDQMELKHMDKSLHSSAISAGSVDGPSALVSSTLTLGKPPPAEYEPARHMPPAASLDRRHLVPTYVERRSPSCGGSEDSGLRSSPASGSVGYRRCDRCDYRPMTGVGVGVGCAATCERRQLARLAPDQSTPLLSGVGPLGSPQSSLASLAPLHSQHPSCNSGACNLGPGCCGPASGGAGGGELYACARERGHYVAYEPLPHYTHRDSLSSDAGPALSNFPGAGSGGPSLGSGGASLGSGGPAGSLQRGARGCGALHSFALPDDASDRSTPTHSNRSVRETSPYKKSASSSPGHLPNRLQLGGNVPHCSEELEPLTPSRSTERLNREMQNLEGLMKDLSAITQHQFHC